MRRFLAYSLILATCFSSAQGIRLQLKFPKGHKDRISMTMKMKQAFSMPGGQNMTSTVNQSTSMSMVVLDTSSKGASVKTTYESATSTMEMNGKSMMMPGMDVSKLIKGKSIILDFSPTGEIRAVKGIEGVMAASMKSVPEASQGMFKEMFNEKSIKDMWRMSFGGYYPSRAMRVGESWTNNVNFGSGPMSFKMAMKSTVLGTERRGGHSVVKLGLSGTGSMDMSGMAAAPGMSMKTDRFEVTGVSYFDLDRGWPTEQNMSMKILGSMTMTAQGAPQKASFSSKMDMIMHVKPTN